MSTYVSAIYAIFSVMYGFVATPSFKLYSMVDKLPDTPGQLLARLRKRAGYASVRAAAEKIGISHTRLGEIEASLGKLGMTLSTMQRIADAYGVPLKVVSDIASGVAEVREVEGVQTALEAVKRFEVQEAYTTFRVFAGISAGEDDPEPIEGEVALIPREDLRRAGAAESDVKVFRVNGDCMLSESARGLSMSICSGDKIAVDTSQRLVNPNDVVAAYWRPHDKLVVKRYVEEGEHIVLKPTSPAHAPLIAENNDDFLVIGKVIWRGGPFR